LGFLIAGALGAAFMRPLALFLCLMLPLSQASGHGAYHDELLRIGRELETKPEHSGTLYRQRAVLHIGHEDWQAALVDLERVDRLQAGSGNTNGLRGQALNLAGQWAAAQAVLTAHLTLHPDDVEALFHRGRARYQLGDGRAAVTDYQAVFEKTGALQTGQVSEMAEAISEVDGPEAGASFMERVLVRSGSEPGLLERAVELHLRSGQIEPALRHLASLQRVMPRPEPVMARRAQVLEQTGRQAEAWAAWAALRDHLLALPNLDRGTPGMSQLLRQAEQALGVATLHAVSAPPAAPSLSLPPPKP
jgi:tetratricopeptide (TPR) repeat protein